MSIYLDHAATTYVDQRVLEKMLPYFSEIFGNPSSVHGYGRDAEKAVMAARRQAAEAIGASAEEIVFTSGGTESDNWALRGIAEKQKSGHIITSRVEHHAVLDTCRYLETQGFDATYLPVNETGMVSAQSVREALREDTILISVMFANNETGTIMPIREIGQIAREKGVLFHTDAVQAVGHVPVDVEELGIDMLSMSAHKFYGPKGAGALYLRRGTPIAKLLHGGAQERDMRASTLNVAGIVGLGAAAEIAAAEIESNARHESELSRRLAEGLLALPGTKFNGHETQRLPGHVNISFSGIEAEALLTHLDLAGVAVSAGSACSSGSTKPSYVLLEMGLMTLEARGAVRFTIGRENTRQEIDEAIEITRNTAQRLQQLSPLFMQRKGDEKRV
jgi:Cysteine sulfinate desulfinase/cysteine desulfurase and related enzymes